MKRSAKPAHWSPNVNASDDMNLDKRPSKSGLYQVGSLGIMVLLGGCFFDQVQKSEEGDIQRVEQKQATLKTQQERAATLQRNEQRLTAELSERQLTLDELTQRVEALNAENGHALADNDAARRRYELYLQQLHETNEQLALVEQSAAGADVEERRERIAELKARLKTQIDALLN
jgi:hypothetical protein